MQEITIFYSWQSDLPKNTNSQLIRDALHLAIPELEDDNVKVSIDEATRNKPGSPNIPATIIEKIKCSDIFVGDITTINHGCECGLRKTPNPNVVFELGFAINVLGWDRIVLLLNKNYSNINNDLPFDFDRHRVTAFDADVGEKKTYKAYRANLSSLLKSALATIINQNPTKEIDKKNVSPEELKRKRDLENIEWILSAIHQPSIQEHFETGPRVIEGLIFHFWESFNGVFTNNLFHLYDRDLYDQFEQLFNSWERSVSFGDHYRAVMHSDKFVFSNPMDMPLNERQEEAWAIIEESLNKMNNALSEINNIIRYNYLEIDLNQMNNNAWNEYLDFIKDNS